jgi:hypothetical protein
MSTDWTIQHCLILRFFLLYMCTNILNTGKRISVDAFGFSRIFFQARTADEALAIKDSAEFKKASTDGLVPSSYVTAVNVVPGGIDFHPQRLLHSASAFIMKRRKSLREGEGNDVVKMPPGLSVYRGLLGQDVTALEVGNAVASYFAHQGAQLEGTHFIQNDGDVLRLGLNFVKRIAVVEPSMLLCRSLDIANRYCGVNFNYYTDLGKGISNYANNSNNNDGKESFLEKHHDNLFSAGAIGVACFGASCNVLFENMVTGEKYEVPVHHGDVYVMRGTSRFDCTHSLTHIAPDGNETSKKETGKLVRVSVLFTLDDPWMIPSTPANVWGEYAQRQEVARALNNGKHVGIKDYISQLRFVVPKEDSMFQTHVRPRLDEFLGYVSRQA